MHKTDTFIKSTHVATSSNQRCLWLNASKSQDIHSKTCDLLIECVWLGELSLLTRLPLAAPRSSHIRASSSTWDSHPPPLSDLYRHNSQATSGCPSLFDIRAPTSSIDIDVALPRWDTAPLPIYCGSEKSTKVLISKQPFIMFYISHHTKKKTI